LVVGPLFNDLTWREFLLPCARLLVAAGLGGAIGLERQARGQYAGLRTHILVTLGAASFVLLGLSIGRSQHGDVLRVLQGVVIGVGFLGTGAILKGNAPARVRGLTTAGGIWNAAAIGAAAGAGYVSMALAITAIALAVLGVLRFIEVKARWAGRRLADRPPPDARDPS
jgi:putative Mg2+ transporter-C (MgtC) family protein